MKDPSEIIRSLIFDIDKLGGKKLYHYTDANGLIGILNSRSIRATNYRFLNDPSEHEYGLGVVKQVVEKFNNPVVNGQLDFAYQSLFVNSSINAFMVRTFYVSS